MSRLSRLWKLPALLRDRWRLRRTALFDPGWYLDSYPDLRAAGRRRVDPAWHYLAHGAGEGRDPGPGFSTSGYALQGGAAGRNPLLHYLDTGRGAGRAACPSFAGTAAPGPVPMVLFFAHQALGRQFGAERSLLTMLDRAGQAGLAVEVVLPHCLDAGYLAALQGRARRVHLLPYAWRRGDHAPSPVTVDAMERLIRASGAAEVHQNTLVLDAPLLAAQRAGVPSVVYLRELPDEDPALCARLETPPDALRAALLAGPARFIANSAATARWIDPEGRLPDGRLTLMPNAVDPALAGLPFAPPLAEGGRLRVGLVGSNTAKKGVADMLAVARSAAAAGLAAEFRLIGPDSADLAALGPLPVNLRHMGYAADPLAAMEQIDVLLSLSRFAESFGRTVLEAMTAGRPVICYDRGTPPDLVGRAPAGSVAAGIIVPADAPEAVAQAVGWYLAEPGRLAAASDAARARAAVLAAEAAGVANQRLFSAAVAARHAMPASG